MRRRAALAAVCIAFWANVAAADTVTTVTLKNGDVARGTVVELVQGDHVTLQLATGQTKVFPWADVGAIAETQESPPPAVVAPPPPPAVVAPPPPPVPGARVHLVANDEDARLGKDTGLRDTVCRTVSDGRNTSVQCAEVVLYKTICAPPCDAFVPAGTYHVIGEGLRETGEIDVPESGAIRIDAHMRSNGRRTGGLVLLFGGIGFTLVGATFLVMTSLFTEPSTSSSGASSRLDLASTFAVTGGVMLGVGLVALGFGIWLTATSSSSATVAPVTGSNTVGSFVRRGFTLEF